MFEPKIKIERDLYERLKKTAEAAGYSSVDEFVVHLLSHLAYHLGQLDYHRRVVTGENRSIGALPVKELGDR